MASFVAALFVVLAGLFLVSAWFRRVPIAKILFPRVYANTEPVLLMLPLLLTAFLLWRAIAHLATRRRPSLAAVTIGMILVIASSSIVARWDVLASWAERARFNRAHVDETLCRLLPSGDALRFRGFDALEPGHETVFHLQLYDYLTRGQGSQAAGPTR
jgi:hypothetical protein